MRMSALILFFNLTFNFSVFAVDVNLSEKRLDYSVSKLSTVSQEKKHIRPRKKVIAAGKSHAKNRKGVEIRKRKSSDDLQRNCVEMQKTEDKNPKISEAKSGGTFSGDLSRLPQNPPKVQERPKRKDPKSNPQEIGKCVDEKSNL